MLTILVASLHHLLAFTVFASLVIELMLFRKDLPLADAKRLQIVDTVYGLVVLALIGVGLLRVFFFSDEGPAHYFASVPFWTKMITFGVVGALSAYPTIRYISWAKATNAGEAPVITDLDAKLIPWLIRGELLGIAVIVVSAVTLAQD
jgi:putative membrane protein